MAAAIHAVSPCPESILGRQVTPPGRPRRWTGVHRWRLLDLWCWCPWIAGPCPPHRTPPPSQTSRRNPLKPVAEPPANQSQNPSQTSRRTARKPVAEPRIPIRDQGFFELPTNRKESVKPRPAFGVGGLPTGFLEDY